MRAAARAMVRVCMWDEILVSPQLGLASTEGALLLSPCQKQEEEKHQQGESRGSPP